MQRDGVMVLQAPIDTADLRRKQPAATRGVKTPFVEGALAMLWITLIVLLVPVVILLVGLPIAAVLRLMVEVGAWLVALAG